MAALDPSEEVVTSGEVPARATLKIVRNIFDVVDDYDEEDDDEDYDEDDIEAIRRRLGITGSEDEEEDEDEEDSDEEMVNGAGPSDPEKIRKIIQETVLKKLEEDEEDEEMADIPNGINGTSNKGKARAFDAEDDDASEDGMTEYVVCTLDLTQVSLLLRSALETFLTYLKALPTTNQHRHWRRRRVLLPCYWLSYRPPYGQLHRSTTRNRR